jgi:hypothetical protein
VPRPFRSAGPRRHELLRLGLTRGLLAKSEHVADQVLAAEDAVVSAPDPERATAVGGLTAVLRLAGVEIAYRPLEARRVWRLPDRRRGALLVRISKPTVPLGEALGFIKPSTPISRAEFDELRRPL